MSIFDTIRQTIDKEKFKDFVSSVYDLEFKGGSSNTFCPFHSHNYDTPSLGISEKDGTAFFNCFACNTAGDIVKFVELKEGCSPSEAAKKVCDYFGIPCTINTKQMSEEEKRAQDEHLKILKAESEKRAKDQQAERDKRIKQTLARLKSIAPTLISNKQNNYEIVAPLIEASFPFYFSDNFKAYATDIVGYSFEHKSLAIIIRDEKGEPFNIRYREKYAWDEKQKALSYERMSGKWVGEPVIPAYPFPLKYFLEHTDDRVIICEGEKDALNLLSFNIRCLTLGGVGVKWSEHKYLLKDKDVYIWFDHDEAGYINAVERYHELKDVARSVRIVLFYMLTKNLKQKYDISDYISENMPNLGTTNIYDLIAFSCFKPTNVIINEISDYFPNLKGRLNPLKPRPLIKHFDQIFSEILQRDKDGNYINIFTVKGQKDDEEINFILKNAKDFMKDKDVWTRFKEAFLSTSLIKEIDEKKFKLGVAAMDQLVSINKAMRTNYHQTHIMDMVQSFEASLNKLGYFLAQSGGVLYFWTKTHYAKVDMPTLKHFIQVDWMPKSYVDVKKSSVDNTVKIVENLLNRSALLDVLKREDERRIVNFKNGTAFISKNAVFTFRPSHNKNDVALNILDFEYDINAKCPKWDRFLKQVLPDEDDRKTLAEFMGYCFLASHAFESFLFLYGKSGANGKSVILDTIRSFFGDENVSSLQLQQFEGHQLYGLKGKLINIGSEIDKNGTDKGQLQALKTLVSTKDRLTVNPKNKDQIDILPPEKPKLIFSGNEKPKQGLDNGFFRRMLFLPFNAEIKDKDRIRNLADRFNDELAGILNWAMNGLKRLVTQNKFTRSKRMIEEIEAYKDDVNPIRAFVRDAIIADEKYLVPNKYLYGVYRSFIEEKGGTPMKEKNFFNALNDECLLSGFSVSYGQKRLQSHYVGLTNDRPRCAFGIRLSSNLDFDAVNFGGQQVMIEAMSIYQINGAKADE